MTAEELASIGNHLGERALVIDRALENGGLHCIVWRNLANEKVK